MNTPQTTNPASPSILRAPRKSSLRVYRHYDLIYWWVVWAYAGAAALMTSAFGVTVEIAGKAVKVHPEPALGIGFVVTFLFVVIFTAIRARGVLSAVLVLCFIIAGAAIYYSKLWAMFIEWIPSLRIHMNQAFYVIIFAVLFPIWLLSTFVFNRLHYYTFGPGRQVGDNKLIGDGSRDYAVAAINVNKMPDDIFVHRILGLWWLGGGTGDIEVSFAEPGGGTQKFILSNVWRANQKVHKINQIIGA